MFVLPTGNLVDAGPLESRVLVRSTWTWEAQAIAPPAWPTPQPPPPGDHGSAAMYEPGKIVRCGGEQSGAAVDTTWVIDLRSSSRQWLLAAPMNKKRRHHNLVLLPDGKVLAIGGEDPALVPTAVLHAELFDPAAGSWTLLAPSDPNNPRAYHSTAMLLPDSRVVSAGANNFPTAQIYNPPYINDGAVRATILTAPAVMQYGQQYTITYLPNGGPAATVACLIRLASVTHGFDQDQRRVPLVVSLDTPPGTLPVAAPANSNLAPPGYYMLFILSEYAKNKFAPCTMARYVQVGP